MKTREFRGPPPAKMFGKGTFNFLNQPSARNSNLAGWLDKSCEVVQVEIVRPVVAEGINTHDGVEEIPCEGQRPGISVDREHAVLHAGIPDSLHVLRGVEPQVGCPNLHTK